MGRAQELAIIRSVCAEQILAAARAQFEQAF
jgi:hypothetical protein